MWEKWPIQIQWAEGTPTEAQEAAALAAEAVAVTVRAEMPTGEAV